MLTVSLSISDGCRATIVGLGGFIYHDVFSINNFLTAMACQSVSLRDGTDLLETQVGNQASMAVHFAIERLQ